MFGGQEKPGARGGMPGRPSNAAGSRDSFRQRSCRSTKEMMFSGLQSTSETAHWRTRPVALGAPGLLDGTREKDLTERTIYVGIPKFLKFNHSAVRFHRIAWQCY